MSQDELVDIIDEDGNFIKVVSKREAHVEGLLHKAVISSVIDSRGRYLLTKASTGRQDGGQYVFPSGGHVSAGESEDDALKREVYEELGLQDFKYEFVGRAIFNREVIGRKENHFFNLYKVFSDQEPRLDHEHESYKYFTEEELKRELKENPKIFGDAFFFVAKKFFPNLM